MHFTSVDTRGGQRGADSRGFENERKTKNQNKKQTWADSFFPRLTASTAREVPGSHDVTDTNVASAVFSSSVPPMLLSLSKVVRSLSLDEDATHEGVRQALPVHEPPVSDITSLHPFCSPFTAATKSRTL